MISHSRSPILNCSFFFRFLVKDFNVWNHGGIAPCSLLLKVRVIGVWSWMIDAYMFSISNLAWYMTWTIGSICLLNISLLSGEEERGKSIDSANVTTWGVQCH
jgi:hypothetical protein